MYKYIPSKDKFSLKLLQEMKDHNDIKVKHSCVRIDFLSKKKHVTHIISAGSKQKLTVLCFCSIVLWSAAGYLCQWGDVSETVGV